MDERYTAQAGVAAMLEKWARSTSPPFVKGVLRLLGGVRDGIRAAQYELGMPYIYQESRTLAPGANTTMPVNVKNYGEIDNWQWIVTNTTAVVTDIVYQAGVIGVSVAAQKMFSSNDGTFPTPRHGTTEQACIRGPFTGLVGGGGPNNDIGNLRRIPVAQGDVIEVDMVNNSTVNTYQITFIVSQYRTIPPAEVYPDRQQTGGGR